MRSGVGAETWVGEGWAVRGFGGGLQVEGAVSARSEVEVRVRDRR